MNESLKSMQKMVDKLDQDIRQQQMRTAPTVSKDKHKTNPTVQKKGEIFPIFSSSNEKFI